ncbi:MAG: sulfatase-like hydrolase/transferase, partial [Nocardioidaceae bacterium]
DHGWDRQRELTLQRQHELGVVASDARLAPWADGVPSWDDLDETERRVAARFMETYAGFAEHTDVQVGRLVDALAGIGELDNTLFIYILGDNGASGEGGIEGTLREHLVGHGIADDSSQMIGRLDAFGDPTTYGIYPVGWALAMNTPYQWTKQVASHYGGTRDGMVVRWGNRIADPGNIRHQWHHVIDVLPTILEAAGVPEPSTLAGVEQMPIEGTGFAYTFDDATAAERHTTQYFEMCGNRGIYHEGWTAVTRHGKPWEMVPEGLPAFDDDVWELYDTTVDWTQAEDLATTHPEKLHELQQLFEAEAAKHQVFPLDDRVTERENPEVAGRPDLTAGRTSMTYRAGMGRFSEETTLNTKNRSHTVTASITVADGAGVDGTDGVIIAQGGRFGGWSLYVHDGRLCYAYNCYGRDLTIVRAPSPLSAGPHEVCMVFTYDGGPPGSGTSITLYDEGEQVGSARVEQTTAYYFSFDETLNIGRDPGTPVSEDYPPRENDFGGAIDWVRVDLTGEPTELTASEQQLRSLAHQ